MISNVFGAALAANRDRFNARMRDARRRTPSLSPESFGAFLQRGVTPLVDAVARSRPDCVAAVVDAAYDAALSLAARKLVAQGARSPVLGKAWASTFVSFAPLIATQPAQVLGMLSNAIVYLETLTGTRPQQWMAEMAALAPRIGDVAQLAALGQIAAWRAGAAHFRDGAINAAATLPASLALAALCAPAGVDAKALLLQMIDDPWWRGVDDHARGERELGAFAGFGGAFGAPPHIKATHDGFVVRSGERFFFLNADAYGAVLQPAGPGDFDAAQDGAITHRIDGATLQVGARRIAFDLPAAGLTTCVNRSTIAIASAYTHAIRLLPR